MSDNSILSQETVDFLIGLGKAEIVDLPDGAKAVVTPRSRTVKIVDGPDPLLAKHIEQDVKLTAIDSLIAYINAFKNVDTRVFADIDAHRMEAVLDYHNSESRTADYAAHRAALSLDYSPEFRAWKAAAAGSLGQVEFAEFIEDNDADILSPAAAPLKEAVLDLKSHVNVVWKSKVNLTNGAINAAFSEEGATGGEITLPEIMEIAIPIFRNDPDRVKIRVFVRHRIRDGKIHLKLTLHRIDMIVDETFGLHVERVVSQTDVPVHFGQVGKGAYLDARSCDD